MSTTCRKKTPVPVKWKTYFAHPTAKEREAKIKTKDKFWSYSREFKNGMFTDLLYIKNQ